MSPVEPRRPRLWAQHRSGPAASCLIAMAPADVAVVARWDLESHSEHGQLPPLQPPGDAITALSTSSPSGPSRPWAFPSCNYLGLGDSLSLGMHKGCCLLARQQHTLWAHMQTDIKHSYTCRLHWWDG